MSRIDLTLRDGKRVQIDSGVAAGVLEALLVHYGTNPGWCVWQWNHAPQEYKDVIIKGFGEEYDYLAVGDQILYHDNTRDRFQCVWTSYRGETVTAW